MALSDVILVFLRFPISNQDLSYNVCLQLCLVTELTILGCTDAEFDSLEKEPRGYVIPSVLMRARGLSAKREVSWGPLLREVVVAECLLD